MTPEEMAERFKTQPFDAERLMGQILIVALGNSQRRTPVGPTGNLRRSETTRQEDRGRRGYLGTNIKYGAFVHEGTRYMSARPFFVEGVADSRAQIDGLLQKAGDDYVERLAK